MGSPTLARLSLELGLAVNDYNAELTDTLDEISKLSLAYLHELKNSVADGTIDKADVKEYFSLVGQSWGSIQPRFANEYIVDK
jgi:hypothetical protein